MRLTSLFAVAAVLTACCAAPADWPQFLGPGRNGASSETGLASSFAPEGPKALWTVTLGVGYGGPAVQGGKVYVLDRVDGVQDVLRCLDLATGKEDWTFAYRAVGMFPHPGSRSTPAVDDRFVFTVGPMGHFHCVSKQTRQPVWKMHLLEDFDGGLPRWAISQSPLLHRDWVIVAPQGPKVGLAAYDKATGKPAWQSGPIGEMKYCSPILTSIDGVEQVVMASADRIVGVEAATGKILWQYDGWKCRNPIPPPTPIGDGRFFITGGYDAGSAMFRVARRGEGFQATHLLALPEIGSQIHAALLHDGHLYLLGNTNSAAEGLVCLDLDGNVKWKTGRSPGLDRGSSILADGRIYLLEGKTGELVIIEPNSAAYGELARAKLLDSKEMWAPMALTDGKLLLRDQGQMKCVILR